ncbi:type IV pilus assembly protein PilV [Marinobacter sp. 3-2]|jgi:type IV pilus assembly protein PilV|uniref:type IV pilus modification protein PilV n=1 Tax=Marinobacter sp. 3-2 TaxID=2485141 RepID=UPI000D3D79C0|nr:type IV pilus modification protein PilV [Marinobacter sp. 3-2]ROQ38810.1 type IV pilus assembly protein PilV [Marinobacter sp. 3-2]
MAFVTGSTPHNGFTLIEVLVALLVLLVGLLGVVGMQYLSLQQVNNSNLRSQVNLHALEMVEMIRANDNNALVAADVDAWEAALDRDIPGAEGAVAFNANTVNVTITWDERQYGSDAAEQTYTMTARLEQ